MHFLNKPITHIKKKSKKRKQKSKPKWTKKKNAMTEVWVENEMVLNSLTHFNIYNKSLLLQLKNKNKKNKRSVVQ